MNNQSQQMKFIVSKLSNEQIEHLEFYKTKLESGLLELSPSAIKKIVDEPLTYFNEYVCGDFDDKETAAQKRGTLIHTLLLEEDSFDDRYAVMEDGLKIPEGQTLEVLTFVANNINENQSTYLGDHEELILEAMKEANFWQKLVDDKKDLSNTGDKKRLEKILISENIAYFESYVRCKGKEIISAKFYEEALFKAELLKRIKEKERIIIENEGSEDVSYELELKTKHSSGFNLKCIIDILKVDVAKKKVFITDVKSIGGKLATTLKFDIEKYRYGVQAAVNFLAVKELISSEAFQSIVPGSEKFSIDFGFLFIDGNNTSKYVHVSNPTMERYVSELYALLKTNVNYHISSFDFSAPYEYLKEDVIL